MQQYFALRDVESTSEGTGGQSLGEHGHSKDHRPDLRQMVVGVALDVQGRPVCCEMWPGNTADAKSLLPVVERMRAKFRVREMCVSSFFSKAAASFCAVNLRAMLPNPVVVRKSPSHP